MFVAVHAGTSVVLVSLCISLVVEGSHGNRGSAVTPLALDTSVTVPLLGRTQHDC
jgi:hypothetical protein